MFDATAISVVVFCTGFEWLPRSTILLSRQCQARLLLAVLTVTPHLHKHTVLVQKQLLLLLLLEAQSGGSRLQYGMNLLKMKKKGKLNACIVKNGLVQEVEVALLTYQIT